MAEIYKPTIPLICAPYLGFVFTSGGTVNGLTDLPTPSSYGGSIVIGNSVPLTPDCCQGLITSFPSAGIRLVNDSECRWTPPCTDLTNNKLILSPEENYGAFFDVDENEECVLQVSFDYILLFDCDTLLACSQVTSTYQGTITGLEDCRIINQSLTSAEAHYFEYVMFYDSIPEKDQPRYLVTLQEAYNEYVIQYNSFNECWTNWTANFSTYGMGDECARTIGNLIYNINSKLTELANLYNQLPNVVDYYDQTLFDAILALRIEINAIFEELNGMLQKCQYGVTIDTTCDAISVLNSIKLSATVEMVSAATINPPFYYQAPPMLQTVHSESFFNIAPDFATYISGNTNTGLLFTGNCTSLIDCILNGLGDNCSMVSASTFNSGWVHHSFIIDNPDTLALIENQRIKIGIVLSNCICNFSLLLDNIEINKICKKTEVLNTIVNTSPGFSLTRRPDNKKSWVYTESSDDREYDLVLRDTNYDINHSKLVINTKEVDINLDGAAAIECNVFDYLQNNNCIINYPLCLGYSGTIVTSTTEITLVNNSFVGSLSGWTVDLDGWDWHTSNYALYDKGTVGANLYQTGTTLSVGHTYNISASIYNTTTSNNLQVSLGGTLTDIVTPSSSFSPIYSASGSYDIQVTLECTSPYLVFFANGLELTAIYEVRVQEIISSGGTPECSATTTVAELLSTSISDITTTQEFVDVMQTELIDVKSRKVLSAYPTLQYIYDAYNDPFAFGCNDDSRHYNYCMLTRFINLIGSYWTDIIEQVVPATTIWGSAYVFRNTIFHQPKFKYKRGTLHYCIDCDSPSSDINCSIIGCSGSPVSVEFGVSQSFTANCIVSEVELTPCDGVYITQVDDGSEFYGNIMVSRNPLNTPDIVIVSEN